MPIYVTLLKFTEQGVKTIKDLPERIEATTKNVESLGGKVLGLYLTMGEYDMVSITEWPSDAAAATAALAVSSGGNVRTMSMRAFTPAEIAEIVKKLP